MATTVLPSSAVVPFDNLFQLLIAYILAVLAFIGMVFNFVILFSNVTKKSNSPSSYLVLSLVLADFAVCSHVFTFLTVNIFYGGWASGLAGCLFSFSVIIMSCYASVQTLLAIAIERYNSICWTHSIGMVGVTRVITGMWTVASVMAILPLISGTYHESVELEDVKLYCVYSWEKRNASSLFGAIFSLLALIICMTLIFYCYYSVYQTFTQHFSTTFQRPAGNRNGTRRPSNMQLQEAERLVLTKCSVISITFAICWLPYTTLIAYEIITGVQAAQAWQGISAICVTLNSFLNPILLVRFDNRISGNTLDFLRSAGFLSSSNSRRGGNGTSGGAGSSDPSNRVTNSNQKSDDAAVTIAEPLWSVSRPTNTMLQTQTFALNTHITHHTDTTLTRDVLEGDQDNSKFHAASISFA